MRFSDMIEGLQILAKCDDRGTAAHLAGAEHDAVFGIGAEYDPMPDVEAYLEEHGEYPDTDDTRLSPEDNARLRGLGWFIDLESECWKHYC